MRRGTMAVTAVTRGSPMRWRRTWLAWGLWMLNLVGLVVLVWLDQLLRQTNRPELVVLNPTAFAPVLGAVSTATVGAVVASRRPAHPVGWLLLALGLSLTAAGVNALRTLKKLLLGETLLLPAGLAIALGAAVLIRALSGASWADVGGFILLAGVAVVLLASVARTARRR